MGKPLDFLLKYSRHRETLPDDVCDWPLPNEEHPKRLSLHQPLRYRRMQGIMIAAMRRNDIDTIALSAHCIPTERMKSRVTTLFLTKDHQNWKVEYHLGERVTDDDLEWLVHLQDVRLLSLVRLVRSPEKCHSIMEWLLPFLRLWKNLEELDLVNLELPPSDFVALYQDDFLAERTPYIRLGGVAAMLPIKFPPGARRHLQGLRLNMQILASFSKEWLQEISQLKKLRMLMVGIPSMFREEYPEPFHALSSWINSPRCRLHTLSFQLMGSDECRDPPPDEFFQGSVPSLSKNRSITHLEIFTKNSHISVVPILLSSAAIPQSGIVCLTIHCDNKRAGPKDLFHLVRWQMQLQSTRFLHINLDMKRRPRDAETSTEVWGYQSHIRKRWWNRIQYYLNNYACMRRLENRGARCIPWPFSVTTVLDQQLWAYELERIDETQNANLRFVSLDIMYFLLQQWLSAISDVPTADNPIGLGLIFRQEKKMNR